MWKQISKDFNFIKRKSWMIDFTKDFVPHKFNFDFRNHWSANKKTRPSHRPKKIMNIYLHLKFCRENNLNSKLVVKVHGNQVHLDPAPPSTSATPTLSKSEAVLSNDRSIPHKFTFDHSYWYENSVKKYFQFC